jgi:hypothetical protein
MYFACSWLKKNETMLIWIYFIFLEGGEPWGKDNPFLVQDLVDYKQKTTILNLQHFFAAIVSETLQQA